MVIVAEAVGERERVSIIGPNGAGKTTTLLMILGAIEPDDGTVRVDGHVLPAQRSHAMRSVGFAAGYLPLPDRLKVVEARTPSPCAAAGTAAAWPSSRTAIPAMRRARAR